MELTTDLLKRAYGQGFFPMPHPETGDILWFNPDPRAVIPLDGLHVSRSLRRRLRQRLFTVTIDRDFPAVMAACAEREETWITAEFTAAYTALHREGSAHSVEVWQDGELVGGTYGVAVGGAFFAESKFHRATDASKVALVHLVEHLRACGMVLLEVQFLTPHLQSLGAVALPKKVYLRCLQDAINLPVAFGRLLPADDR